jgi:hypothetical protein
MDSPGVFLETLRKTVKTLRVRAAGVSTERLPIRGRHTQRYLQTSLFRPLSVPSDETAAADEAAWFRLFTAFQIIQNNLRPGTDGRKGCSEYTGRI